ncbi:MAG: transposase zinc-binding domain-containing protein [Candidatus Binatia bacterium]
MREFLRCGIAADGFVRVHCDSCGHDRVVPFSGKRRGVCVSCAVRRMAETAANLADRVMLDVPVRQWVLSIQVNLEGADMLAIKFGPRAPEVAGKTLYGAVASDSEPTAQRVSFKGLVGRGHGRQEMRPQRIPGAHRLASVRSVG